MNGKRKLSEKEAHKAARSYQYCDCAVWFSGTWNGQFFPRQTTGLNSWAAGEDFCAKKMNEVTDGILKPEGHGIPLADALARWHEGCRLDKAAKSTMYDHERFGGMLLAYCAKHGIKHLADVAVETIQAMRVEWIDTDQISDQTHRHRYQSINTFFRWALRERLIKHNPMSSLKAPARHSATKEDTMPLDLDGGTKNYENVLVAIRQRPRGWHASDPMTTDTDRCIAFTEAMYEAGLRISDALNFDVRGLKIYENDGCAQYEYRPIKTEKRVRVVHTFMPVGLAKRILALAPLAENRPFCALTGSDFKAGYLKRSNAYRTMLVRVGELAGVPNLHPHRFRNSCAVNRINEGMPIWDVSRMLGHTSVETTEDYYLPWVKSREVALRASYTRARQIGPHEPAANVVEFRRSRKRA